MSDLQHQQPPEADNPEETIAVVKYEPSSGKYDTGASGDEKAVNAPSGRVYHFDRDGDQIPIFAWAKQDIEFFRDYESFEVRELL